MGLTFEHPIKHSPPPPPPLSSHPSPQITNEMRVRASDQPRRGVFSAYYDSGTYKAPHNHDYYSNPTMVCIFLGKGGNSTDSRSFFTDVQVKHRTQPGPHNNIKGLTDTTHNTTWHNTSNTQHGSLPLLSFQLRIIKKKWSPQNSALVMGLPVLSPFICIQHNRNVIQIFAKDCIYLRQ